MGHCNHAACINTAMNGVEEICAKRGLRFTDIRRKVLKIIWHSHKVVSAADVMQKLGNSKPPITYRALEFLEANGFIHRVSALNAFVGCPHPQVDHASQLFICADCKDVTEISSPALEKQMETEARKHAFAITRRHIEVLGRCQSCQTQHAA